MSVMEDVAFSSTHWQSMDLQPLPGGSSIAMVDISVSLASTVTATGAYLRHGDDHVSYLPREQLDQKAWTAIGWAVIAGLFVSLIGTVSYLVVPVAIPLVLATIGMAIIVMALWLGTKIDAGA